LGNSEVSNLNRSNAVPIINSTESGHGNFTSPSGNQYWAYSDHDDLYMLQQAIAIIDRNVRGMRPCNDCFSRLPGGRTFDAIWADRSIWISYEPRADRGWYGVTFGVGGKDISISRAAFAKGRWWVAGTLVHELAHVNGAPADTTQADATLLCCGLRNAYEGVIGLRQSGSASEKLA
jgi:hypothetical protein